MEGSDQEPQRAYAWTLWEVCWYRPSLAAPVTMRVWAVICALQLSVPITEEMRGKEYSIVVRAVDSSQNSQVRHDLSVAGSMSYVTLCTRNCVESTARDL